MSMDKKIAALLAKAHNVMVDKLIDVNAVRDVCDEIEQALVPAGYRAGKDFILKLQKEKQKWFLCPHTCKCPCHKDRPAETKRKGKPEWVRELDDEAKTAKAMREWDDQFEKGSRHAP